MMRTRAAHWLVAVTVLTACGSGDGPVDEPVLMPDPTPVQYPLSLWDRKVEGETEVLVHVNEVGDVDSAYVSETSGYEEFDSAAVSGARKLRFTPGKRGDRHVAMWTRIPVRFARDSTGTIGTPRPAGARNDD